jgi:hypothetical protein
MHAVFLINAPMKKYCYCDQYKHDHDQQSKNTNTAQLATGELSQAKPAVYQLSIQFSPLYLI